ncbi:AAA domain-containing protein [Haematococcus lacustris]
MAAAEASARNDLAQADAALRSAMDWCWSLHRSAGGQARGAGQGGARGRAGLSLLVRDGAGDSMLTDRVFKAVVLDEATQGGSGGGGYQGGQMGPAGGRGGQGLHATEPATLIPLVRGAQCVVMAGDPRQLPPTVCHSSRALALRLDVTLFDRVSASGVAPLLLDTQYRMHPAIAAFASQHFYQGRLRDGVEAADKPAAAGFPWPAGPTAPLAWLEVRGREETAQLLGARGPAAEVQDAEEGGNGGPGQVGQQQRAGKGTGAAGGGSYQNLAEAEAAIQVLQRVLAGGDVSSVALLTPYRGQVRALEAGLRGLQAAWPQLAAACEAGRLELSVSSVDGFQGREADVVILSTVRCNRASRVGFVADPRRLNVAITRPRRGLVVVGCSHTLAAGSDDWAAFVRHCEEQGVIMPLHALSPAARQHVTGRR